MSKHVVYVLRAPGSDVVRYVGRTQNIGGRSRQYATHSGASANSPLGKWLAKLKATGVAPELEIMAEISGRMAPGLAHDAEKELIRFYDSNELLNVIYNPRFPNSRSAMNLEPAAALNLQAEAVA